MKRIIYLVLLLKAIAFSAPSYWNSSQFEQLSDEERYQYVHEFNYWEITQPDSLQAIFIDMWQIADQKSDIRSTLAIQYYCAFSYLTPGFSIPYNKTPQDLLNNMFQISTENGFEVEKVVANYYLNDYINRQHPETYTREHYSTVVKTFEQMESLGLEKFEGYGLDVLLFNLGKFMWNLEDFESAYLYFSTAEHYIKPNTKGALHYTLVLNHLQEYWYKKKAYEKSVVYSKKILSFHNKQPYSIPPHTIWWKTVWQTLTHLNISKALIKQGKLNESTLHAKKSLQLSKLSHKTEDIPTAQIAQYDALSVLITIKMELNQTDSLQVLFNQALDLQQKLKRIGHLNYFKPLPVYENLYKYYTTINSPKNALFYLRKVKEIQDSSAIINDHLEIRRVQKKLDLEKYTAQLNKANKNKQIKSILIYLLGIGLLIGLYFVIKYYIKSEKSKTFKQHKINVIKKEVISLNKTVDITTKLSIEIQNKYDVLHSKKEKLNHIEQLKKTKVLTAEDWSNFKLKFEQIYPDFIPHLKQNHPQITNAEQRLLVLEKLDLNTNEIAEILGVNKNTIHQTRRRFRKKIMPAEE